MACEQRALAVALIALAVSAGAPPVSCDRHLLSHVSDLVSGHLREEASQRSVASLGRMLLAFNGLGILNEDPSLGLDLGLKDKLGLKPDKLGLGELAERVKSEAAGLADKNLGKLKEVADVGQKLLSGRAAARDLGEDQVGALAGYFSKLITREQQILEAVSGGAGGGADYSYLVDFPDSRVRQMLLPLFGAVDVESLSNLTSAMQDRFCSPLAMLPRRHTGRRTIINGPSFELTLAGGRCELLAPGSKKGPLALLTTPLNCTGHEVSYSKTPLSLHRRHVIPEAFASEECHVERLYGTPYEKVLHGGGPLVRFDSMVDFIDAVADQKYNFLGGFEDVLAVARGLSGGGPGSPFGGGKNAGSPAKGIDFWSALGPGRLLKDKKLFGKKKLGKLGLGSLLDFDVTSPLSNFKVPNLLDGGKVVKDSLKDKFNILG
eukprot:evm.model.scf_357.3 EVM.evm.TU.scf_357.3   scf_357:34109-35762(-)